LKSQRTAENKSAVPKSPALIGDCFQRGKVGETADANLLQCPFFVEKKLGHSLNQLKVQQLCVSQFQQCPSPPRLTPGIFCK